ncbi:MAG: hypothetical protein AAF170_04065 [Bacteroidota bacterium]
MTVFRMGDSITLPQIELALCSTEILRLRCAPLRMTRGRVVTSSTIPLELASAIIWRDRTARGIERSVDPAIIPPAR